MKQLAIIPLMNPDMKKVTNLSAYKVLIEDDSLYLIPTELELLIGVPAKANEKLGWKPKYDSQGLIGVIV